MIFWKYRHLIFYLTLILHGTVSCIAQNTQNTKYVDPTKFSSSTTGMFSLRGDVPAFRSFNSMAVLNRANFSNSGNAEYMIATSGAGSTERMQYFSAFVDDLDNPVSDDFVSRL